jgi:hypothetical protein
MLLIVAGALDFFLFRGRWSIRWIHRTSHAALDAKALWQSLRAAWHEEAPI